VQQGCIFGACASDIRIGAKVDMAAACAFYAFSHGTAPGRPVMDQPLETKGGIEVGDGAWLGHGVIVLDGVRIGAGAIIGAGSVVLRDIPENAIAVGAPARVIRFRGDGEAARGERAAVGAGPALAGGS
jgi:acetyltransferase-like isoleucine patch superfamily enzyme